MSDVAGIDAFVTTKQESLISVMFSDKISKGHKMLYQDWDEFTDISGRP